MNKKFRKYITKSIILATSIIISSSSFAAGLSPVHSDNNKWGFENDTGTQIVSAKYDGVGEFTNGFAPVFKDGKWGFINEQGKEITPISYTGVANFRDGFAPVLNGSKWGMINSTGQVVVPFEYEQLYYFDSRGKANAMKNGKWGKVDKQGKVVVPFMYDKSDIETKAKQSRAKVIVDGKVVDFDAYNIEGNNYLKLRDIAFALNGSNKQFEVDWNQKNRVIDLISNKPYTPVGGELEKSKDEVKNLRFNESSLFINGKDSKLMAYSINDNNYFKLRDIARVFNVGIGWDHNTKTVEIDTTKDYVEEN